MVYLQSKLATIDAPSGRFWQTSEHELNETVPSACLSRMACDAEYIGDATLNVRQRATGATFQLIGRR